MRARLAEERGVALITAILVLVVIMALGFAAVNFADGQQRGSQQERTRESSFNLGEAALNAQVFQLGNAWPTAAAPATSPCTPATSAGTCPDPSGLNGGYAAGDYTNNGCAQPLWKTLVQDDTGGSQYYNAAALASAPAYDANNDGKVWVRVTTNAQCHQVTMVGLAARVLTPLSFPQNAVTANWFKTGNTGSKTIVNTQGKNAAQSGNVYMRCNGGLTPSQCLGYKPGQVSPNTAAVSPNPGNTTTLTTAQLTSMRQEAQMAGTYWPTGCPTGAQLSSTTSGALPGAPVYVVGPCNLTGPANSAANPGTLILMNGTYTLGGNQIFYGLLYLGNVLNVNGYSNSPLVTLGGCSHIYGMVVIDGNGGINVGQCGQDVVYDPTVLASLRVYSGATLARNSFQVLPASTPGG